jgi:L-alanine-DL-glutamate epimerase-like enolase superfamily enzyme
MGRITQVEARTVVVPLDKVTSFARRTVRERHYVLVRVADSAGVTGIGFCYAGTRGGTVVSEALRSLVGPLAVGQHSERIRGIWEDIYHEVILLGRAGAVSRAHSALDIALWDLNARTHGVPLWQYLGATAMDSVPAYASGGYYLPGKTPEHLAEEMRRYVQAGARAVKLKVGNADYRHDAERVAAVRQAVGDSVDIMLDANNAWRDFPAALRAIRSFEPFDPFWIEEPFGPDDIENHARLAKATPVPVATGELEAGRWRHKALLDAGAAAILQPDAAVCGGVTEFQRIANTADSYGVTIAPHWFHDLHVHLVASTPNALLVEFFPDDKVLNFRTLLDKQLEFTPEGRLKLPTSPGLGFDFDPAAVERFATDNWK